MIRFRLALVVGLSAGPAAASSPDPKDLAIPPQALSRARDLVRLLGSDLFRERETAHAELTKMGRLAKPILIDAASTDPDPEVRARANQLLPRAAAEDMKARVATFLADADGRYEHNMPGWGQFRKTAGSDKAARDLYVEMIKSAATLDLLAALDQSAEAAGRAIADRRHSLYSIITRRFQGGGIAPVAGPALTIPDVAALLLAESVVDSKQIPQVGQFRFVTGASFLQQQPAMSALATPGAPHADVFRKLVGAWLETRVDPQELSSLAYLASSQLRGFKEAVPLLRRIVSTDGVQGYARGQAITALVRERGKDEIPLLKGMLKSDAVMVTVWLGNVGGVVNNQVALQARDLALAHLLTLHGQDLKAYGFESQQGNPQALTAAAFGQYAFVTDDARTAAFKKWEAFEKAQPKPDDKK